MTTFNSRRSEIKYCMYPDRRVISARGYRAGIAIPDKRTPLFILWLFQSEFEDYIMNQVSQIASNNIEQLISSRLPSVKQRDFQCGIMDTKVLLVNFKTFNQRGKSSS